METSLLSDGRHPLLDLVRLRLSYPVMRLRNA